MSLPYDDSDKNSIINYANRLVGQSLRTMCPTMPSSPATTKSKGKFGQLLEEYYFLYKPNSNPQCDFPKANLELKSTPLKELKSGSFVAKERLVLSIIDYNKIVAQTFKTSSLFLKSASLLLVCYLYRKGLDVIDYNVHLVGEWTFPEEDLIIIQKDWDTIQQKVKAGMAHEISERDTLYLSACTKGATSKTLRTQPFSTKEAKQRAYSLKQSYVNYIILSLAGVKKNYGKLLKSPTIAKSQTIEEYALSAFDSYIGLSVADIFKKLKVSPISESKSYYARISKLIMSVDPSLEVEEFVKAGIELKTIRVGNNGTIKEHLSFPAFKYVDFLEEAWADSVFYEQASRKYLFVFFKQQTDDSFALDKVAFWNMPKKDLNEVQKVWSDTRKKIAAGTIVEKVEKNVRYTHFISAKENPICHIRPHATTTKDTYPLPVADKLTGVKEYTKHCFWLNREYILANVYLKS